MLVSLGLSIGLLVYIAFLLDLLGFLARDELWWRSLMLGASAFYLVYYYAVTDVPLWDALYTNGFLALVNLAMIVVVIVERTTFSMSTETANLYRAFPMLTPGQFRRLLRAAHFSRHDEPVQLTSEGHRPDHLWFLVDGQLDLSKAGQAAVIEGPQFVGEIAYLTGDPASATVTARAGAQTLRWTPAALDRLIRRSPNLQAGLVAHFNLDLARKVAASQPAGARLQPERAG